MQLNGRIKAVDVTQKLLTLECFGFGTAKDKEKLEPEDINSFKSGDEKYVVLFLDFYEQKNDIFEEFEKLREKKHEENSGENFMKKDLVTMQDMKNAYDETTPDQREEFLEGMKGDMKLPKIRESENERKR